MNNSLNFMFDGSRLLCKKLMWLSKKTQAVVQKTQKRDKGLRKPQFKVIANHDLRFSITLTTFLCVLDGSMAYLDENFNYSDKNLGRINKNFKRINRK